MLTRVAFTPRFEFAHLVVRMSSQLPGLARVRRKAGVPVIFIGLGQVEERLKESRDHLEGGIVLSFPPRRVG